MSVTFGKNIDTGMTTLKFDSTDRTVEFTPTESNDFDIFLETIKTQGKVLKQSIGSKAVYALQQLGAAVEEGDPEIIASTWLSNRKIVDQAVLNNIIEKIEYENPFCLYFINDDNADIEKRQKALVISMKIKKILDDLVENMSEMEITSEYEVCFIMASSDIKAFYDDGVGVSDTVLREAIHDYLRDKLAFIFPDDCEDMSSVFYTFYL